MVLRLWKNAAWDLRFPLYIQMGDDLEAVVTPSPWKIALRVTRLLLGKIFRGHGPRRAVLSFDDGPYEGSTEELLAVLAQEGVPATFFMVGRDAVANAASAQAVVTAGMEIASHSMSHRRLTELSADGQMEEVAQGKSLVEGATGASVSYFRPPHGAFDMVTLEKARESRQTVALWNVNPADYDDITAEEIVERVVAQQRNPAVILLHSGRPQTIAAIPEIVRRYRALGFSFVTMGQLDVDVNSRSIREGCGTVL